MTNVPPSDAYSYASGLGRWPFSFVASAGGPVFLVPGDSISLFALPVPAVSLGQRRIAAGFAVEPFLARPLDSQRIVLGPVMSTGTDRDKLQTHLLCVIDLAYLREIETAVPAHARLVPEPLLLPRPDADRWLACARDGRVVVRLPDGTGFSAKPQVFVAVWTHAGQPELDWAGDNLPDIITPVRQIPMPKPDRAIYSVNLAENALSRRRVKRFRLVMGLAIALSLLAHPALLAIDLSLRDARANVLERKLREEMALRGIEAGESVEATAETILSGGEQPAKVGFLDIFSHMTFAMAEYNGVITMRDISFGHNGVALSATLEALDIGTLQAALNTLSKAGFQVETGAATVTNGKAVMTLIVSDSGAVP